MLSNMKIVQSQFVLRYRVKSPGHVPAIASGHFDVETVLTWKYVSKKKEKITGASNNKNYPY